MPSRSGGEPELSPKSTRGGLSTPATVMLARAGVDFTVHPYTHDPESTAYGDDAVRALEIPADRVFKTLVAAVDGELTVAVVPVPTQLDMKALAAVCGAKRATMAEPGDAARATGYVVGGISPLGQRRRLPTVVDSSVLDHETVFVSAGRRGLQVELAPPDLVRLTAALTGPIARTH